MDAQSFRYNNDDDKDKQAVYDNGDAAVGVAIRIVLWAVLGATSWIKIQRLVPGAIKAHIGL